MGTKSLLLTHPLGAPFVTNAILAFEDSGVLNHISSTINFTNRFIANIPFRSIKRELLRRRWIPEELLFKCNLYPWPELTRLFLERTRISKLLGLSPKTLRDNLFVSFDNTIASNHSLFETIDSVYAYEDSAALTFKKAASLGIRRIYDLPIAFYKEAEKIQKEEAALFPEFANALEASNEPEWKKERKDQEIELADLVIVPSNFVRSSLEIHGIPHEKIAVAPFGAPSYFHVRNQPPSNFRVLFVGRIGPRKGVHYLIEAWKRLKLKNAKLTLVGLNEFPKEYLQRNYDSIEIIQSTPHLELEKLYHTSSVLVLPSLVEGFGLVLLEAMGCGIPVIATKNSGAEDLVTEGVDGFIIDIRSVEQLMQKIEWMYKNQDSTNQMGQAALQNLNNIPGRDIVLLYKINV